MKRRFSGTYADLQGIPTVEALWEGLAHYLDSPTDFVQATYFVAADVAAIHIEQQLQRSLAAHELGKRGPLIRLLGWAQSYSRLRVRLLESALQSGELQRPEQSSSAVNDAKLEELVSHIAVERYSRDGPQLIKRALEHRLDSSETRILHCLRLIQYYAQTAKHKRRRLLTALIKVDPTYPQKLLDAEPLYGLLLDHPLSRDRESLNAFRGLHQIPEMLALTANKLIEKASQDPFLPTSLQLLNDILAVAIECVEAMFSNLTARSYHEIRDYLGQTSGSQSTEMSKKLLRSGMLALSRVAAEQSSQGAAPLYLRKSLSQIRHWRDLHSLFPLLYLGSAGTKSLIGAVDALTAALNMRDAHLGRDGAISEPDVRQAELLDGIESIVQPVLSDLTQSRFAEVQLRTGFFSKKGH